MPLQFESPSQIYFMPQDGVLAQEAFLKVLNNPLETWIIAYGFTLQPMFDEILAGHNKGVVYHIILDHSQEAGKAEAPKVQALIDAGVDVVVATEPGGFIVHDKAMTDSNNMCIEGSTNFSLSAWKQANTMNVFQSPEWAQAFRAQFEELRAYALANEPQFQLKPSGTAPVVPPNSAAPTSKRPGRPRKAKAAV